MDHGCALGGTGLRCPIDLLGGVEVAVERGPVSCGRRSRESRELRADLNARLLRVHLKEPGDVTVDVDFDPRELESSVGSVYTFPYTDQEQPNETAAAQTPIAGR